VTYQNALPSTSLFDDYQLEPISQYVHPFGTLYLAEISRAEGISAQEIYQQFGPDWEKLPTELGGTSCPAYREKPAKAGCDGALGRF
jgi:hypothetical protein